MSRRRLGFAIVGAVAAFLLVGRVVARWVVEYRWYEALGATGVFWVGVGNMAMLRGGAFAVASLLFFANLYAVRYSVVSVVLPRRVGNIEIAEELPGRTLVLVVLGVSLALGALMALLPAFDWTALELVRHGETFRESDPWFQVDLAFWVYWLPLEEALHAWTGLALLLATALVTFLYALTPSLRWEKGRLRVSGHVRRHLFLLCSAFLLLLAWTFRLDAYGLLLDGAGTGRAFLASDRTIGIPGNLVLAMSSVVVAMLIAWAGWMGQLRMAIIALAALLLLALGVRQLLPPLAGRLLTPGEAELRDRPYLATRAAFSRRAFDTERLAPSRDSSSAPGALVPPAAAWDTEALVRAGRTVSAPSAGPVRLGWGQAGGRPTAILAQPPRGFDVDAPWLVGMVDAAASTEEGALVRPLVANDQLRQLPRVIVGDSLVGGSVVIDSAGVIAAPDLGNGFARLVHAWGLQNPRLLGETVNSTVARVTRIRDVRERVERLFPFFMQGNRVTPLVASDTLYWAVHLYVASAHYPLSDPIILSGGDVTYFRHAAVAVANAHTGRVVAIRAGDADPVARSWFRRVPSLFVPPTAVPEGLLEQVPPPTDAILSQTRVFARFGRRGESGPPGHLARETGADTSFAFPSLSPFVDPARRRLAVAYPILDAADQFRGVVVGSGGADVRLTWHAVDSSGPSWGTIIESLRRALDSAASPLRAEERPALRGPVRAFVHRGRVVLLQSAYAVRGERTPYLRLVAVRLGDTVHVARTLGNALGVPEPVLDEAPLSPDAFRQRVTELYAAMNEALARRDLSRFAETWEALGRVLRAPVRAP